MKSTRRELGSFIAAFAANASAQNPALPSHAYKFEELPVRTNGKNKSRAVLDGTTHTGFAIEMHETELGPGMAPHPPHKHVHEELIMIREGILEVTISGNVTKLGPGSAAYVASGEEHGWKNVGDTQAHYFVMALRGNPKTLN